MFQKLSETTNDGFVLFHQTTLIQGVTTDWMDETAAIGVTERLKRGIRLSESGLGSIQWNRFQTQWKRFIQFTNLNQVAGSVKPTL